MIYLIIGQKGVGKTHWLKKIAKLKDQTLVTNSHYIDLDEYITQYTKKPLHKLIDNTAQKQKRFRQIEKKLLYQLIKKYQGLKNPVFIAIGAGWRQKLHKKILSFCHVIHLERETDPKGRVFLNKPRLSQNPPFLEYQNLYKKRNAFYRSIKDESLVLPEYDFTTDLEKVFFNTNKLSLKASITLNRGTLPKASNKWSGFINKRLNWGLRFFELRDDEWSKNSFLLNKLLHIIPKKNQLLSLRGGSGFLTKCYKGVVWDWALEESPPSLDLTPPVVSLHQRGSDSFYQCCKKLSSFKACHLKLAVPVDNFTELLQGHKWFLKDPKNRSFLPLSDGGGKRHSLTGAWRWYRQIFGAKMYLNFIRESLNDVADKPFLHEVIVPYRQTKSFSYGAVLGYPINHSASPAFYNRQTFLNRKMFFTKIPVLEKAFTKKTLNILKQLNFKCLAITSPLKKKAFLLCDKNKYSQIFQSINTLVLHNKQIIGYNTDAVGVKKLFKIADIKSHPPIAVWGGGGMKSILKHTLKADFYSARTGRYTNSRTDNRTDNRTGSRTGNCIGNSSDKYDKHLPQQHYYAVVWAVGRGRMGQCLFPPSSWKPQIVVDLNYTADSPGLEYALLTGAKYISGSVMFQAQALRQKEIFLKFLKNSWKNF